MHIVELLFERVLEYSLLLVYYLFNQLLLLVRQTRLLRLPHCRLLCCHVPPVLEVLYIHHVNVPQISLMGTRHCIDHHLVCWLSLGEPVLVSLRLLGLEFFILLATWARWTGEVLFDRLFHFLQILLDMLDLGSREISAVLCVS